MKYYLRTSTFLNALVISALLVCFGSMTANGQSLTYLFTGEITGVDQNENDVVPGLSDGNLFSGYVTFNPEGYNGTVGTVSVDINGIDLFYDGEFIFGEAVNDPSGSYSIRVAGDTGGDIGNSTFSAFNFGPLLIDSDGSAGIIDQYPSSFDLSEFETNRFFIGGTLRATGDRVNAEGTLTSFTTAVPEPSTAVLLCIAASVVAVRRRRVAIVSN